MLARGVVELVLRATGIAVVELELRATLLVACKAGRRVTGTAVVNPDLT